MKDINLNSLRIFLVVATSNSFLEASNKLYISQPAVSKSINKLEEELGLTLFYRANKGICLTSNGEILLKYVKDSEKLLLACERMLNSNNNCDSGTICIGAQSHIVRNYLLSKLAHFKDKHPNVNFRVEDLSTASLIEQLEKHELDFVVDSTPINTTFNNLKITPIAKKNTCFIKSVDCDDNISTLSDLSNKSMIIPLGRSSLTKNLSKVLEQYNVVLNPQYEYATEDLIIASVKKNLGIGYVVDGKYLDFEKNKITKIELKEELPKFEIQLVYIENYITELAMNFITEELLTEVVNK